MAPKKAHNAQSLVDAIVSGDLELIRKILKLQPRLVDGCGNKGERPLLVAAYNLDLETLVMLVDEFHADVRVKDSRGFNIIENAAFGLTDLVAEKQYSDEIHGRYCKILEILHHKYGCQQKASGK